MNFKFGKNVDPGHIFTTGEITLKKLQNGQSFHHFSILGSVKNLDSKHIINFSSESKACLLHLRV